MKSAGLIVFAMIVGDKPPDASGIRIDPRAKHTVGFMTDNLAPSLTLINQYLVDLSFENPAAKRGRAPQGPLSIEKSVDMVSQPREDGHANVDMRLTVKVSAEGMAVFLIEITYRCVCDVSGIAPEALERRLLVEGGEAMFPAVRNLVSGLVSEGGFTPTLTLDPIDFAEVLARARAMEGSPEV